MAQLRLRHQPGVRAPIADEIRQHRRVLGQRRLHDGARLGYRELVRGFDALPAEQADFHARLDFIDAPPQVEQPALGLLATQRAALELSLQRGECIPQAL